MLLRATPGSTTPPSAAGSAPAAPRTQLAADKVSTATPMAMPHSRKGKWRAFVTETPSHSMADLAALASRFGPGRFGPQLCKERDTLGP
jgi:hypothetical protein